MLNIIVTEDSISNGTNKISSIPDITDVFISDPNFNLSSLDFIIIPENENEEIFSLNSCKKYYFMLIFIHKAIHKQIH